MSLFVACLASFGAAAIGIGLLAWASITHERLVAEDMIDGCRYVTPETVIRQQIRQVVITSTSRSRSAYEVEPSLN
jgi:hypothetical protein